MSEFSKINFPHVSYIHQESKFLVSRCYDIIVITTLGVIFVVTLNSTVNYYLAMLA